MGILKKVTNTVTGNIGALLLASLLLTRWAHGSGGGGVLAMCSPRVQGIVPSQGTGATPASFFCGRGGAESEREVAVAGGSPPPCPIPPPSLGFPFALPSRHRCNTRM